MGTEARIVLYAPSAEAAERAAAAAFARIAELDGVFSDYRTDSEVSRLAVGAGGAPVGVSGDLMAVLSRALALAEETGGAFDVSAGPFVVLWREARRTGRVPPHAALREAAHRVGWRLVALDAAARTVRLAVPGMRLDFGGIAKGYAADEALATLRAHGVDRALVTLGGEIVAGGAPPDEAGWLVAVEHANPGHGTVRLAHAALASSGDTEQFVEIGGIRYSHVVDPRTGRALTERVAATVRAPDGMTADAYATAVTVLDAAGRAAFMASHPEATFYVRSVAGVAGRGAR